MFSPLPELWDIFNTVVSMSPSNKYGFSLLMARDYIDTVFINNRNWSMEEFWMCMNYFLSRMNSDLQVKLKLRETRG